MFKRLLGTAALLALSGTAQATVSVQFTPLQVGASAGETTLFDFETASPAVTGIGFGYYSGTTANIAAAPVGNGSRYLSVLANGIANIVFATALSNFSIDIGSADTFNTLTVNFVGGGSQAFQGVQLTNHAANGSQTEANANGRSRFVADNGERISGITLTSAGNSFEVDNIGTAAVPEPATWALMIAGMGLVGAALRRGRRTAAVAC